MVGNKHKTLDPLFQLFEHYLHNRSYEDSTAFTKEVSEEYLAYLDSTPAHVPFHVRKHILEDLESETHELLVKRMYGIVRTPEHNNIGSVFHFGTGGNLKTFDFSPPAPGKASESNGTKSLEDLFKEEPPSAFQKIGNKDR